MYRYLDTRVIHYDTRLIHPDTSVSGVPTLACYQEAVKNLKKGKRAGVIVKHYSDMQKVAFRRALPQTKEEIEPFRMYAVPFDGDQFKDVEAIVLTMHVQINWIGYLVNLGFNFPLHIDGKYKLHHGDWLLITFGTHSLRLAAKERTAHTFRPLLYVFTKQQESTDVVWLGLVCCNFIAMRYFQKSFSPSVGIADHGPGINGGWTKMWPDRKLLGCYPHISWHMSHGKLLPKSHPLFDEASEAIRVMHTAETEGMWRVLLHGLARKWGDDDAAINKMWNSIYCSPYDNWYLGYDTSTPLTYPSNQVEENWHNHGVMQALSREMNASTEQLVEVNLPTILKLDAANNADQLTFSIPKEWLPTLMYQKAAKNLKDPLKYVKAVDNSSGTRWYYVLSQSQTKYSSVTDKLIASYEALRQGKIPPNTAGKYERCVEIMQALHKVEELDVGDPRLVPNPTNPCNLWCNICKAFATMGTCSHVLTVTDLIMQARPEKDRLVECDVQKTLTLVDANNKTLMGASKNANAGAKALNKKSAVAVGQYSCKKNEKQAKDRAMDRQVAKAVAKARKQKDQKERAAVAKKLIGKKPAAKSKKPASTKRASPKLPEPDSSDSSEDEMASFDSSDEDQ